MKDTFNTFEMALEESLKINEEVRFDKFFGGTIPKALLNIAPINRIADELVKEMKKDGYDGTEAIGIFIRATPYAKSHPKYKKLIEELEKRLLQD